MGPNLARQKQKLEMHARLEAATLATRHGWPAGAEDLEELAFEPLEGSRLLPALQRLAPDQREVLLLRMAAELTIPEVAAALGKTTGAVKALQHRGLATWPGRLASVAPMNHRIPRLRRPTQHSRRARSSKTREQAPATPAPTTALPLALFYRQ